MDAFQLQIPTKVIFGSGVLEHLGAEIVRFGRKVLLVYGRDSIKRNGVYDTVMKQLLSVGVEVTEHPGVKPNPVLSHAEEGISRARKAGTEVILAVGGGSVIDAAKAIAAGVRCDAPLWDFYTRKRTFNDALPLVVVQTLPATSSEMNAASVITNDTTSEKFSVRSDHLFPKVSFLDPSLTVTIPLEYTAYACTDILSHMMEGYFTTTEEWIPVQDGMVEGVCRAVIESMERLLIDPRDLEARSAVMWAGALAWNGLLKAGVKGASIPNHMLEHPLSAHHDIAHGAGLSIVIPAWLKYKKHDIAGRIIRFGREVLAISDEGADLPDLVRADRVIEALESWYRKIGTPVSFKEAGIRDPDVEGYTAQALKLAEFWHVPGYTAEDIREIYHLCLGT